MIFPLVCKFYWAFRILRWFVDYVVHFADLFCGTFHGTFFRNHIILQEYRCDFKDFMDLIVISLISLSFHGFRYDSWISQQILISLCLKDFVDFMESLLSLSFLWFRDDFMNLAVNFAYFVVFSRILK